jgi:hypothetical protein
LLIVVAGAVDEDVVDGVGLMLRRRGTWARRVITGTRAKSSGVGRREAMARCKLDCHCEGSSVSATESATDEGGGAVVVWRGAGDVAGMRGGDVGGVPLVVHFQVAVRRIRRAAIRKEVAIVKTTSSMSQMTSVGPIGGEPV